MNALNDIIRELRVRALSQIARLKGIETDEEVVRNLVVQMSDSEVIKELRGRQGAAGWFWKLFHRRG